MRASGTSWALLLMVCAALALAAAVDKRADMSPVPFVMGSRYGRSPARPISPRNDKFFLGSRYGKRADAALAPLGCEITGLYSLYRCLRRTEFLYEKSAELGRGERE